ncbi:MAG: hypothetical protein IJU79_07510 [Desulfovibrionaceae bacterium]|nr:hypothetical protein [Desulfovibrionaceae bacterium]
MLTKISAKGLEDYKIPGKYDNYAHSVKLISDSQLAIADTGNSQIHFFDGEQFTLTFSPLENWDSIPIDAIHVNDVLSWDSGLLVSAFSYQPFTVFKQTKFDWQHAGLGCLYHLQRFEHRTISRIVAAGLQCPHTLTQFADHVYCCASAQGDWIQFALSPQKLLYEAQRTHVTDTHFLRGALCYQDGWILGGSSRRHEDGSGGMQLYYLADDGKIETIWQGGSGEIYDILYWDQEIMGDVCAVLEHAAIRFSDDKDFPPRSILPKEYRT